MKCRNLRLTELKNKSKEELIILYKDKCSEINILRKEMKKLSRKWRDYYRHKR